MTSSSAGPRMRSVVDPTLLGSNRMEQASGRSGGRSGDYVFISYARADEKIAKTIIRLIERAGFGVWWDGLIPSGERFSAKIGEALENSKAVVVLWSASSGGSNWVQDEAAFGRDHQRLVPISIDGSEPPLGFRQLQSVDVSKGRLTGSNPAMYRALQTIADMMDRPLSPDVARSDRNGLRRRSVIVGAAAAGVAAVGFGGWQLLRPGAAAPTPSQFYRSRTSAGTVGRPISRIGLAAELRSTLLRNPALQVVARPHQRISRPPRGQPKHRPQARRRQSGRWQCHLRERDGADRGRAD